MQKSKRRLGPGGSGQRSNHKQDDPSEKDKVLSGRGNRSKVDYGRLTVEALNRLSLEGDDCGTSREEKP
jgi:hypothetical protein